jgi:hypothetical protein
MAIKIVRHAGQKDRKQCSNAGKSFGKIIRKPRLDVKSLEKTILKKQKPGVNCAGNACEMVRAHPLALNAEVVVPARVLAADVDLRTKTLVIKNHNQWDVSLFKA